MITDVFKWVAFFLGCLVVQTTLAPAMAIGKVQPDFLMIVLFIFAVRFGVIPGIIVGFFLGLGEDIFSPSILGQNALSKTIVGCFAGLFNERTMSIDPFMKVAIMFLAFLIHDILFCLVSLYKHLGETHVVMFLLTKTIPRAIYSGIAAAGYFLWDHAGRPHTLQR